MTLLDFSYISYQIVRGRKYAMKYEFCKDKGGGLLLENQALSRKMFVYELPQELVNDLKLRKLGYTGKISKMGESET